MSPSYVSNASVGAQLLLGPDVIAVAALLLAAVGRPEGQACIALAAHKPVLPVLEREGEQVRLQPAWVARSPVTAGEAQHEVKRGLLVDVVVGHGAAILELLPREDEALLVRLELWIPAIIETNTGSAVSLAPQDAAVFIGGDDEINQTVRCETEDLLRSKTMV